MREFKVYRIYQPEEKIISERLVKEVVKTGKAFKKSEILAKIIQESK